MMRDELFQNIVDHCFGNIYVTDAKGKIIYINKSSAESLGCAQEELLGMTSQDLVDRGIAQDAASLEVIRTGKPAVRLIPCNLTNVSLAAVSTPVFDERDRLIMTVTYSQTESKLNDFIKSLDEERKHAKRVLDYIQKSRSVQGSVVAESEEMKRVLHYGRRIAASDSTVMLYGETGTGKEVLARYIHQHSARSEEAIVPVNCAAIPKELMESEFFGYVGGAFTGANRDGRAGLFEIADRGTLFLDEVGELPLLMQSKLLRVLESGEISRVGSNEIKNVDVRIIAATNRDLQRMTMEGGFREDLYYRLDVVPIHIPPLRERHEDIMALAELFLARLNKKYGYQKYFYPGTMEAFIAYGWPGNVRELKNVVERLAVSTEGDKLVTDLNILNVNRRHGGALPPEAGAAHSAACDAVHDNGRGSSGMRNAESYLTLKDWVDACEREYIEKIIEACGGNVTLAAKKMGVHRSGLYKKISKW